MITVSPLASPCTCTCRRLLITRQQLRTQTSLSRGACMQRKCSVMHLTAHVILPKQNHHESPVQQCGAKHKP